MSDLKVEDVNARASVSDQSPDRTVSSSEGEVNDEEILYGCPYVGCARLFPDAPAAMVSFVRREASAS